MINDLVINVETSSPSDVSRVSLLLQIIPSIFSYRLVKTFDAPQVDLLGRGGSMRVYSYFKVIL